MNTFGSPQSVPHRPVAVLDVEGVLVLEDPVVPAFETVIHSVGNKWTRTVTIPVDAADILQQLADRFDIVWISAWAHNAHASMQLALGLPDPPWPFLSVQFHKLAAIEAFAAGRQWVWIDDSIHDLGHVDPPDNGLLVPVDSHRGISAVDPEALYQQLQQEVFVP